MDRERFVGIVIDFFDVDTEEPVEPAFQSAFVPSFLSRFVGEGNESIVFGIAPLSDPEAGKLVLKFIKPDVRFEMTVLHYSFRIAEKLFPNHPLLMTPEERMRRLTDEMLGRIESDGSLFRLRAFRDMLMATIEILARQFNERFHAGTLPDDWLRELDDAIAPMIDDSLVLEIESLLDDDAIVDEARAFFEFCLESIRSAIADAKREGVFHPLSRNRLFKLLGLHLEDFINWDELMTISDSDQFRPALAPDEVADLAQAVSILHFRAVSKKEDPGTSSEDGLPNDTEEYKETLAAALATARYMEAVAAKYHHGHPDFLAFAKNWHARTLLLEQKRSEAVALFEEVLDLPITPESRTERHDALLDLAKLLGESDPKRSQEYAIEALTIRQAWEKI